MILVNGNYFSFDSKFFNTVKQLVFKPAYLSIEFIEGRRIRYINPIQLFVFSSFLYFLVNSFMFLKEETKQDVFRFEDRGKNIASDSLSIEQLDSISTIFCKYCFDQISYALKTTFRNL